MNPRIPSLQQRKDGRYFTKWAGRFYYFGRDLNKATEKYLDSLKEWRQWVNEKADVTSKYRHLRHRVHQYTVLELSEKFLGSKKLEGGKRLRDYYAKHIKRFLHSHDHLKASNIRVASLQTLKDDMLRLRYANKTINHDITAVRSMLRWGYDQELIPEVNLRGCKTLPLGEPKDKSLTIEEVLRMIYCYASGQVQCWLALNYLTGARPTEVVRLVHREGKFIEVNLFRLAEHKTSRQKQTRILILNEEARRWLSRCRPRWSRLDSYSIAVRKQLGQGGPHPLRHSAATHLIQSGATREEMDLILGHSLPRVSLTYARIDYTALAPTMDRLTLPRESAFPRQKESLS